MRPSPILARAERLHGSRRAVLCGDVAWTTMLELIAGTEEAKA